MLLLSAAWACADAVEAIELAEGALLEVRTEAAVAALDQAEQGFACGSVASPSTLARYFLARGVAESFEGRPAGAEFRAAARVEPTVWVEDYGPVLEESYQLAAASPQPTGDLQVDPAPSVRTVWVDGQESSSYSRVEAGLHLVQVGTAGRVEFGAIVNVRVGETSVVPTGLQPVLVEAPPAPLPDPVTLSPWLVTGGASGVAALGLGVASLTRTPVMNEASTVDDLNAAYTQQKWTARGSYALFAVSAVSLTFYVNDEHTGWW